VTLRGRRVRRACAVIARRRDGPPRMVLPAFGTLTGGMDAAHASIRASLMPAETIEAACAVRDRLVRFPLWQAQPHAA